MKDVQYKEEGYVMLSPVNEKSNTSAYFNCLPSNHVRKCLSKRTILD